ncbi:MAG TPA: acireductone synthase [Nitrospira sp.]|nr:acireductone synthase [Nitrospira sp.]
MNIRCVLMDIEGTIVPIAFVRDVLFPYAKHRMAWFLQERRDDGAVRRWADLCRETVRQEAGIDIEYDRLSAILDEWMEKDRKHTGLKGLQGMIWEEGYERGAFAPALYDDVLPALIAWRTAGLQLALYSSGSEQAQRLLLGNTTKGNLTGFFSHFFDTRIGAKTDADSYHRIAAQLQIAPEAIFFLSDVEQELDAASTAGVKAMQIVRPGTEPGNRHPVASDFRGVVLNDSLQSASSSSQR